MAADLFIAQFARRKRVLMDRHHGSLEESESTCQVNALGAALALQDEQQFVGDAFGADALDFFGLGGDGSSGSSIE